MFIDKLNLGLLTLLWILLSVNPLNAGKLNVRYSWRSVEFKYDNLVQREIDISNGNFNPFNVVILDSDYYNGTYYVTTPSLLPGVPVTLSTVSTELDSNGSRLLKPFPSWSWNNKSACERLISAYRIKIDELGRLWAIDSGLVDSFTDNATMKCQPKVLVFDLNRGNKLIASYEFPEDQVTPESILLNVEVQVIGINGEDTVAYFADPGLSRILVYHLARNQSFLIEHPYFEPDPDYTYYNINGAQFNLSDGVFNVALDSKNDQIYFHALSSGYEYRVKGELLRKTRQLTDEEKQQFVRFSYKKKGHTSSEVVTDNGYLIFAKIENNSLCSWNSMREYNAKYFKTIAKSYETLQFPTGMKIINNTTLLVTTSKFQNILAYASNRPGVNFRILTGNIKKLIQSNIDC